MLAGSFLSDHRAFKSRWGTPKSRWGDAKSRWGDASPQQFKYCLQRATSSVVINAIQVVEKHWLHSAYASFTASQLPNNYCRLFHP